MNRQSHYYRQVQLLLRIIPFVAQHDCFALKGGTAINLFVRDFPRLSVDIDLVFLPMMERNEALQTIKSNLDTLASTITANIDNTRVVRSFLDKSDALRLLVERDNVQIKIELSPVLRGTVYEPRVMPVSKAVEEEFGFAEMAVVSFSDLYAGKICAALDRQHPRDLFDIKQLLDREGITEQLRKALLVYIISHPRPIAELLNPHFKDITGLYEGEFSNMAEQDIPLADLEAAREQLVRIINTSLTPQEREFLLSFKNYTPNWTQLGLAGIDQLPAVRWKLQNLARMKPEKHAEAYARLKDLLGM
ncbi:nucleotidyl transferase AbiEii/AbiGii toxin family protein [Escherichia coli]|uniref:nucleotidyl transferase AbiEii/AbiGii toxin family protein n=1 Tax=Gammaproteobacteria TaxID=1236 RepID=UPI000B7F709F|nr:MULTISPECIES: nucleotidyl transferase AbiEii/AbiGii toxin family protein [Enterobacteriaceae]EGR4091356.1 nucleotidyl transferase AbiEii/AbiGii toxin family protein [Vibrio cholerae]HCT7001154.1 nucleotidyl transferase AbiEii/AbiGii toxin family protein [Morganella morganii]EAA1679740.1 nucleotidyl transferase AbiEii/AbiGii toxin family protein [Escherichia coli]EES5188563.1 nucleotidyl transferase AbiEii/AbiGii toxin family protein [Escherichia coli]EEW3969483.1 nucleotidyl transferase Abi